MAARKTDSIDMSAVARELQNAGRRGDTLLVHINENEAAFLRAIGGSGTTNPTTGLLEFAPGGAGTGGSGGDASGGPGGNSGGNAGGNDGTGNEGPDSDSGDNDAGPASGIGAGAQSDNQGAENDAQGAQGGGAGGSSTDRPFSFDRIAREMTKELGFEVTEESARNAALDPSPDVGTPGFGLSVGISRALGQQNPVAAGIVGFAAKGVLGSTISAAIDIANAVAGRPSTIGNVLGLDSEAPSPGDIQGDRGENAGVSSDGPGGSGDTPREQLAESGVETQTVANPGTDETGNRQALVAQLISQQVLSNPDLFDFPEFKLLDNEFGDQTAEIAQQQALVQAIAAIIGENDGIDNGVNSPEELLATLRTG